MVKKDERIGQLKADVEIIRNQLDEKELLITTVDRERDELQITCDEITEQLDGSKSHIQNLEHQLEECRVQIESHHQVTIVELETHVAQLESRVQSDAVEFESLRRRCREIEATLELTEKYCRDLSQDLVSMTQENQHLGMECQAQLETSHQVGDVVFMFVGMVAYAHLC